MKEPLLEEINEGVLVITFNNPEKKNAFNSVAWVALAEALNAARTNDAVKVVILTGAGKDFSAGQDLSDTTGKDDAGLRPFNYLEKALLEFDKPLLMCPKGISVGGGATMLFHADIVYVGESLRFKLPFASLGIAAECGSTYLLPANVGAQRAADLLFSAEFLNANQVVEAGIAAKKFNDDELLAKTLEKASAIAKQAPNTLREIKRCLKLSQRQGIETAYRAEREAMDRLVGGPENIEAFTAFFEKREPKWS
ncbi:enoyl-CoA hydratase [Pseudomaricurvus alkylphenolicus]|uniref:enoyl-CoA hydratase/isomerase family protein n=1 Tax=Pseudomaricurvus alkylphenolicus TaxID=1306991 RepID=UPI0014207208|nr:enoyl-CoA hydratase-related protein [Pseudomaricurvus alkylphenolicus]NIB44653.1 enoyl-CoA hydratase [Pseudomaricurvus alkylphenolicus]